MKRSGLCNYGNAYIHSKETTKTSNIAAKGAAASNANKKVILKNCGPFTYCTSKMNNAQIDDYYIDAVMPTYELIEYSNIHSKIPGSLWKYYRDEPALNDNDAIDDFPADYDNSVFVQI